MRPICAFWHASRRKNARHPFNYRQFDDAGNVLESYWDPTGISHSTVTSMREHKGFLYLAGLENNRIGRIRLQGADPTWTDYAAYWGDKRRV